MMSLKKSATFGTPIAPSVSAPELNQPPVKRQFKKPRLERQDATLTEMSMECIDDEFTQEESISGSQSQTDQQINEEIFREEIRGTVGELWIDKSYLKPILFYPTWLGYPNPYQKDWFHEYNTSNQ